MNEILAVKTSGLEPELFGKLLAIVPEERKTNIRRYIRYDDALRSLMSALLVRYAILKKLRIRPCDISIVRNEFGKPYCEGRNDFFFNVSHSHEWVICATGSCPVGVDIEHMKTIDPMFVERFFSQEEFESMIRKAPEQRLSYFYDLWTLKESYIKAVGRGLFIPLDSFTVEISGDGIIHFSSLTDTSKYHFRTFEFDSEYRVAVCSAESGGAEGIRIVEQNEMLDSLLSGLVQNL